MKSNLTRLTGNGPEITLRNHNGTTTNLERGTTIRQTRAGFKKFVKDLTSRNGFKAEQLKDIF